jgi:hypothetical protein
MRRSEGASNSNGPPRPLPTYFYRLSSQAQRTYLKSDAIDRLPFAPSASAIERTHRLMRILESGATAAVDEAARALVAELCRLCRVPQVRLRVRGLRPHNARGELHGIFYPGRLALIVLWMRTARRHDVVKPKTFLRTLLHEFGHYLDYALLKLDESFHTQGFFKRESFLVRSLSPAPAPSTFDPLPRSPSSRPRNSGEKAPGDSSQFHFQGPACSPMRETEN